MIESTRPIVRLMVAFTAVACLSCHAPPNRADISWTRVPPVTEHPVRSLNGPRVDLDTYSYWRGGPDVVVYIHGGGWVGGTRYDLPGWMAVFQDAGWTIATVDYITGDGSYPQDVMDVMNAVEKVRSELGAKRLVLAGYSAGSFLALKAVERGTVVDGLVIASVPFTPGKDASGMPADMAALTRDTVKRVFGSIIPAAECQCGHKPMYIIYGRQDVITSWAINQPSVAQCGRTGSTTVDLAEGGHEPSACVNNESLLDFLNGL